MNFARVIQQHLPCCGWGLWGSRPQARWRRVCWAIWCVGGRCQAHMKAIYPCCSSLACLDSPHCAPCPHSSSRGRETLRTIAHLLSQTRSKCKCTCVFKITFSSLTFGCIDYKSHKTVCNNHNEYAECGKATSETVQLLLLFKIISRTKHRSLTVQYFTRVFTNHAETSQ